MGEENEAQEVFFSILIPQLRKALETEDGIKKNSYMFHSIIEFLSFGVKTAWYATQILWLAYAGIFQAEASIEGAWRAVYRSFVLQADE